MRRANTLRVDLVYFIMLLIIIETPSNNDLFLR